MPRGTNSYVENMRQWLIRRGFKPKYDHAGIYCIKLDNQIVYIGKSTNMLYRVAEHYVGIQTGSETKYRILAEAAARTTALPLMCSMMPLLLAVSRSKRKSETWKANTSGNIVRFSIRKSPKPTTGDPMMWYRLMPARFCNNYWRAILIEKQCSIFMNRKRSWVFTFPAKRLGSSPPFL